MIVLDTNVVSALLTGARHPVLVPVRNWAAQQGPGDVYVTAITRAEVAVGVAKLEDGRRKAALTQAAAAYFEAMEPHTLDFTSAVADRYAAVTVARQRAGRPISILDAQIAAIALHAKASLATRNTKDFEGVGLRLIDPYQA